MKATTAWYVLVEEDTRESKPVDGQSLKFHRWKLTVSQHVEGGEEAAAATAEQWALEYVPALIERRTRPGDAPARSVFRTHDGAWLVALKNRHTSCHVRITTARLIHVREEVEVPREPGDWKTKLRAFFRPDPTPAPSTRPATGLGTGKDPWAAPSE
ncbi:hypothetical protein OG612_46075 (plasmid) [Streptomyces sp. NBC_01527]|uniref:hypothetical protein n=1 Tax=Streptomyces sp. NBC_01527 TaxID=2903894 RepID=UPI002F914F52